MEPKFRAWDKKKKKMILWQPQYDIGLTAIMADGSLLINVPYQNGGNTELHRECVDADDYIVMQFTGAMDTKGNEVYKGDVLKTLHYNEGKKKHYLYHEIVWDDKWFLWKCVSSGSTSVSLSVNGNCMLKVYLNSAKEFEIIGNIYENPDLLTKS